MQDNPKEQEDKQEERPKNKGLRLLYLVGAAYVFAALLTPLIVIPSKFIFPFIFPKVIFLRVVVTIAAACIGIILIWNKQLRYKPTLIHAAVLFYILALGLSSYFGVDPHRSFWGGHERMLGLISIMHYALFFFLLGSAVRGWKGERLSDFKMFGWCSLWWAFIIISIAISIVGLAQRFGDGVLFNQGGGRVFSTLGNFIYLGNFMAISMIIAIMLFLIERKRFKKLLLIVVAALSGLLLIYSGSRGALLGLIAGLFITGVIAILKEKSQIRKIAIKIIATIAILSGILWLTPANKILLKIPGASRLADITSDSGPRIAAWKASVAAWKEKPLFGWGHENFYAAFNKHLIPESLTNSYYESWFDNAHNVIFNTLATGGVIGILGYFGLYVAALIMLWRRKSDDPKQKIKIYAAYALLLTDFFSKMFVFDTPISFITLFLTLAFIHEITRTKKVYSETAPAVDGKKLGISIALISVIALSFIFEINIKPSQTNAATLKILAALHQQGPRNAKQLIRASYEFETPHIADIRLDIGRKVHERLPFWKQKFPKGELKEVVELTLKGLNEAYSKQPNELHIALIELDLASFLLPDPKWETFIDERFTQIINRSPNRQQLYIIAANIYAKNGKTEKALSLINEAVRINEDVGRVWWERGKLHFNSGDKEQGWDDMYEGIIVRQFVPTNILDLELASRVIKENNFHETGFVQRLVSSIKNSGQRVPPYVYVTEAQLWKNIGYHEKAHELAVQMKAQYPDEIETFKELLEKPEHVITHKETQETFNRYIVEKGGSWHYRYLEKIVFAAGYAQDDEAFERMKPYFETNIEGINPDGFLKCVFETGKSKKLATVPARWDDHCPLPRNQKAG